MSTEPSGSALAGEPAPQLAEDGPAGARGGFALPVSTSFRFALLIAAVVASSFLTYEGIYLATSRGPALVSLVERCRAQALAPHPSGAIAISSALHQASVCYSGGQRTEAWWGLLGIGVLLVVAGAIFLAQPWWTRRRTHLTELAGPGDADLVRRLESVRQRAGTGPVVWLLQPLNARLSAFTFGRPGRRFVAVSGGAAVAAIRKPAAFEAVILHELAHIKNRDIDQTYLALAIWRAFVVAALLPLAVVLIVSRVLGEPQLLIWRMAVLAVIVYSLRNAILRSREFDADARARTIDHGIALDTVLADRPARTGRQVWPVGWKHPSGRDRVAALADPAPLFRFGFWDGLAIGLVTALGTVAAHEIVTLLSTTIGIHWIVPAIIFAALAGPALAVAMWRRQLREPDAGQVRGWAAGLGLGLGLAVGPVVTPLAAYSQALAPDHPSLASFGILAVWIVLVVLTFTPFPVWIGHWADAWQLRGDTPARVPARGAMVAAAVAAWAVMAAGLYLLQENSTEILGLSSAADEWHELPEWLRGEALVIAQAPSGWLVCLLVVGMPVAAAVAYRRWRRPAGTTDGSPRRRRWLAPVLLGLAGSLAAVALLLAVSALAHARIAEAVRWSPGFAVGLSFFDQQAIVVIAVVCALVAAAGMRSALGVALSVVVGAAVAAIGGVALPNVQSMEHCFTSLSVQYAHPPAGGCLTTPDTLILGEVVLGAALVSLLFVPAAYAAGMLLRRRIRRPAGRQRAGRQALGWLAAAVAAVAAIAGTALWAPSASAQGIKPAGSIGHDGWIRGYGYTVRLIPNWYDLGSEGHAGLQVLSFPLDGGYIVLDAVKATPAVVASDRSVLRRLGAHPAALDGTPGSLLARPGLAHHVLEQWFVVRGPVFYLVTLYNSTTFPEDAPYLQNAYAYMLSSWHWTS